MNAKIAEAAAALKRHIHFQPKIGIILGSGLDALTDEIEEAVRIRFADIPHFPVSSVDGHRGEVVAGRLCGASLFALSGRVHFYEGYSMQQVVFPIRVMAAFGVKTVIVASAVGAVNESYRPGDIVAISDHINLIGDNPLRGSSNFVDLTEAYSRQLRDLAQAVADKLDIRLQSGVYVALSGPCYETPAEIRALRSLGADIVGMSTVPEVIMANSLGMRVLGFSMVTNKGAGMSAKPLSHQDVIKTSKNESEKFIALVKGIIEVILTA
jgi:purine-nucleoside phosphorylase